MKSVYEGAVYLSLAATIWGGMYVVSKYVMETIPPFTLLFLRYLIASLLLTWLCWYRQEQLVPHQGRKWLFQIGFIGYFLSIAAQFIGTKLSSAHMGSMVTTLSPVFLSGFAILLLKERINIRQLTSIVIAFTGVLVVVGVPGIHGERKILAGNITLVTAALFWGYQSVIAKKASQIYSPLQITTWGIILATFFTLPCLLFELNIWDYQSLFAMPMLLSICYLGIISTALAFFSWNKGLSMVPSHQAGLFFFFQPVVGTLLGWLLLSEHLSKSFFVGSLLIIFAVYINIKEE